MAKFNPPDSFNFTKPGQWNEWLTRFERYRIATKLFNENQKVQVASLIYAMGPEAENIFKTFDFETEGDENKYETVSQKFTPHFIPKRNIIHERAIFHRRNQDTTESVEEFIRTLYELAEHCDFADKDQQIRDRIVIGIADRRVSEKLQLTADLTLNKAIEIARQSEMIKVQLDDQVAKQGAIDFAAYGRPKKPYRKKPWKRNTTTPTQNCSRCGKDAHDFDKCPAKGKRCRKCNKMGHFKTCCKSKIHTGQRLQEVNCNLEELFLGAIDCPDKATGETWSVCLPIHGRDVRFKIDTGADASIISKNTFLSLKEKPALHTAQKVQLHSPGGKLKIIGQFNTDTVFKSQRYYFRIFVVDANCNNLLSRSVATTMGLVKLINDVSDSQVFGDLGIMKTDPVKICLKDGAVPYSINAPRRIAIPLLDKVKAEILRMEKLDVIQKIEEPTEWCAPMVPVIKKTNKIRLCVDLKQLNQSVQREVHILPTVDDIGHRLKGAIIFSTLDCSSSFWQLPLDSASAKLTTFITPFGRYFFKRMPYGLSSATEIFQKKLEDLLKDIPNCFVDVDDVLVFGKDKSQHDQTLKAVLHQINDAGLKLNKSKCKFRQSKVTYLGHEFSSKGMSAAQEKVEAIKGLPPPGNVTEVRQFTGMVNYLGRYIEKLQDFMHPITELLQGNKSWSWDSPQKAAFQKVKELISTAPTLQYFDPKKETVVSADASSYGLGGVLLQEGRPIAFCSKTLSGSERNYAQIEKECYAAVFACEKFSRYLVGLESFKLQTDHKPLVPLLNNKPLDSAPLRIQRLLIRMMKYNAIAEYTPGKYLAVADALSRNPLPATTSYDELVEEIQAHADCVLQTLPASEQRLNDIVEHTKKDCQLPSVINYVLQGWPTHERNCSESVKCFFHARNCLSYSRGLLLYGSRIVIPTALQGEILRKVHDGHQGVNKCLQRAQDSVWWPKIISDIKSMVALCELCQTLRPNQHCEPLKPTELPSGPFEKLGTDLFEYNGKKYLVIVDYYSRYIEICELSRTTSPLVIGKLKGVMARFGICSELVSDNGPPFNSQEFADFAKSYDFTHRFSSPFYPISNGEAERAVQTAKRILATPDPYLALLAYRSSPHSITGFSPSELCLGRKLRTTLPVLSENLVPKTIDPNLVKANDASKKMKTKQYYDNRHGAKLLTPLNKGDTVRVKLPGEKRWGEKQSVSQKQGERSYIVNCSGSELCRNRKHPQKVPQTSPDETQDNSQTNIPDSPVANQPTHCVIPESVTGSQLSERVSRFGRVLKPLRKLDL